MEYPIDALYRHSGIIANMKLMKNDGLVKSRKSSVFVIPANEIIQENNVLMNYRVRGNDGLGEFLRAQQRCRFVTSTGLRAPVPQKAE